MRVLRYYKVSRAFLVATVSPVVAKAVSELTPRSPGQMVRSRFAPSTSRTCPVPINCELSQPLAGGGHCLPCEAGTEHSCTV